MASSDLAFFERQILEFKQFCAEVRTNIDKINLALKRIMDADAPENILKYQALFFNPEYRRALDRVIHRYEEELNRLMSTKDKATFIRKNTEATTFLRKTLAQVFSHYGEADLPVPEDFPTAQTAARNARSAEPTEAPAVGARAAEELNKSITEQHESIEQEIKVLLQRCAEAVDREPGNERYTNALTVAEQQNADYAQLQFELLEAMCDAGDAVETLTELHAQITRAAHNYYTRILETYARAGLVLPDSMAQERRKRLPHQFLTLLNEYKEDAHEIQCEIEIMIYRARDSVKRDPNEADFQQLLVAAEAMRSELEAYERQKTAQFDQLAEQRDAQQLRIEIDVALAHMSQFYKRILEAYTRCGFSVTVAASKVGTPTRKARMPTDGRGDLADDDVVVDVDALEASSVQSAQQSRSVGVESTPYQLRIQQRTAGIGKAVPKPAPTHAMSAAERREAAERTQRAAERTNKFREQQRLVYEAAQVQMIEPTAEERARIAANQASNERLNQLTQMFNRAISIVKAVMADLQVTQQPLLQLAPRDVESAYDRLASVAEMNIQDLNVLPKYCNTLMAVANAAKIFKYEPLSRAVLTEVERLKNTLGVDASGKVIAPRIARNETLPAATAPDEYREWHALYEKFCTDINAINVQLIGVYEDLLMFEEQTRCAEKMEALQALLQSTDATIELALRSGDNDLVEVTVLQAIQQLGKFNRFLCNDFTEQNEDPALSARVCKVGTQIEGVQRRVRERTGIAQARFTANARRRGHSMAAAAPDEAQEPRHTISEATLARRREELDRAALIGAQRRGILPEGFEPPPEPVRKELTAQERETLVRLRQGVNEAIEKAEMMGMKRRFGWSQADEDEQQQQQQPTRGVPISQEMTARRQAEIEERQQVGQQRRQLAEGVQEPEPRATAPGIAITAQMQARRQQEIEESKRRGQEKLQRADGEAPKATGPAVPIRPEMQERRQQEIAESQRRGQERLQRNEGIADVPQRAAQIVPIRPEMLERRQQEIEESRRRGQERLQRAEGEATTPPARQSMIAVPVRPEMQQRRQQEIEESHRRGQERLQRADGVADETQRGAAVPVVPIRPEMLERRQQEIEEHQRLGQERLQRAAQPPPVELAPANKPVTMEMRERRDAEIEASRVRAIERTMAQNMPPIEVPKAVLTSEQRQAAAARQKSAQLAIQARQSVGQQRRADVRPQDGTIGADTRGVRLPQLQIEEQPRGIAAEDRAKIAERQRREAERRERLLEEQLRDTAQRQSQHAPAPLSEQQRQQVAQKKASIQRKNAAIEVAKKAIVAVRAAMTRRKTMVQTGLQRPQDLAETFELLKSLANARLANDRQIDLHLNQLLIAASVSQTMRNEHVALLCLDELANLERRIQSGSTAPAPGRITQASDDDRASADELQQWRLIYTDLFDDVRGANVALLDRYSRQNDEQNRKCCEEKLLRFDRMYREITQTIDAAIRTGNKRTVAAAVFAGFQRLTTEHMLCNDTRDAQNPAVRVNVISLPDRVTAAMVASAQETLESLGAQRSGGAVGAGVDRTNVS